MKVLIDFSQIVISSAIQHHSRTNEQIGMDLLRHIALNSIIAYKGKFRSECSDVIICADDRNYWRRDIFPLYKKNRLKAQDKMKFDWDSFYVHFNALKEEYEKILPFPYIQLLRCEADDVISVLAKYISPNNDVTIVSSDKDLIQIQMQRPKVKQFSHKTKKFIKLSGCDYSLFGHCARGDTGDGIPNILSDDDVFMNENKRQKPLTGKILKKWEATYNLDNFVDSPELPSIKRKFERNRSIIDLEQIPEDYKMKIVNEFRSKKPKMNRLFDYCVDHKLSRLLEKGDFS